MRCRVSLAHLVLLGVVNELKWSREGVNGVMAEKLGVGMVVFCLCTWSKSEGIREDERRGGGGGKWSIVG